MADGITATVTGGEQGLHLSVRVDDPDLVGKQATFTVEQRVRCKVSSPVHKARSISSREFRLQAGIQGYDLPPLPRDVFTYSGEKIDIELNGRLEVDDGVFFDTKIEVGIVAQAPLPPRQKAPADAKSVHSPGDSFNFFANLRAIPAKARLVVIWLILVGLPVIALNAVVGVRDQMVPESQVWFYDHSGDDGSESPLLKALAGSGAFGFGLWLAIRQQLRKYMDFSARLPGERPCRGGGCKPAEVFQGQARVALEEVVVRLVAYNREHGQYTKQEKSGNSTRTVTKSFTSESRGVVLYEQKLFLLPPETPLADALEGEIRYDPLFEALYPPMMIGDSHGLSVQLEAQLLHPEFVDHDVELPVSGLEVADFHARL